MASLHLQHSCLAYTTASLPPQPSSATFPTGVAFFPSKAPPFRHSLSAAPLDNAESSSSSSQTQPADRAKLAFEKAQAYKQKKAELAAAAAAAKNPVEDSIQEEVPDPVKAALEKAKEYKKNKGLPGAVKSDGAKVEPNPGVKVGNGRSPGSGTVGKLSLSKIDFVGLDFGDKKSGNRLPAGLMPTVNPYLEGELPEVEIIVGDPTKFTKERKQANPQPAGDDNPELYKPKVSTWGVYPRPANISKAFGGGKTIRPGDALETEEERLSKEIRTKQLLAAYKNRIGLNISPKLKSECEKILSDADSLMDSGNLKDAITYYQEIMDKLPYGSEIHGLAALQWSICQDSLLRSNEARAMYEKLQSHPVPKVSKRARQFAFSFQAMEMMKVTASNFPVENTGYKDYFDAFVEDKASNYSVAEDDESEGVFRQALLYIIFLVSPIFMILYIAVQGKNVN